MFRFNIIGLNIFGVSIILAAVTRIVVGQERMTEMDALLLCGVLMAVADGIYRLRSQVTGNQNRWLAARAGGWVILPAWGVGILLALLGWMR
jgi:hypothetical protein